MITIRTGLPGAGKTLFTVHDYIARPPLGSAPVREVYVSGIDLVPDSVPFIPLDEPTRWMDCPAGSLVIIDEIGSSLTPNSYGVLPNTFCDPSDDCDTESFSGSGSGTTTTSGTMTNGQACFPSAPTSSTSSSNSSCPSGYSVADSSGCVCSNSSGSFVPSNTADNKR